MDSEQMNTPVHPVRAYFKRYGSRYHSAPYKSRLGRTPFKVADSDAFHGYLSVLSRLGSGDIPFYLVEEDFEYITVSNGVYEVDFDPTSNLVYTYTIIQDLSKEAGWKNSLHNAEGPPLRTPTVRFSTNNPLTTW
jgi:hypothetical protein